MSTSPDSLLASIADRDATPCILVSACLAGLACRYDGGAKNMDGRLLDALLARRADPMDAQGLAACGAWQAFQNAAGRKGVHPLDWKPLLESLLPRRVIPVCPELFGGMPCPRLPADFFGGDGAALLDGRGARLVNRADVDVSDGFLLGAKAAVSLASSEGATLAVLKEGSPSCGVRKVHIDGAKVHGAGVASEMLRRMGVVRITEEDLAALEPGATTPP